MDTEAGAGPCGNAFDAARILAAAQAQKKKTDSQVLDFAKMMHKEHGQHVDQTLKLGEQIGAAPAETAAVDKLRVKGAAAPAQLVALNGNDFAVAYMDAMVRDHNEALQMIDGQLLGRADNGGLKKHRTNTRAAVAQHLDEAKRLQGEIKRTAAR